MTLFQDLFQLVSESRARRRYLILMGLRKESATWALVSDLFPDVSESGVKFNYLILIGLRMRIRNMGSCFRLVSICFRTAGHAAETAVLLTTATILQQ